MGTTFGKPFAGLFQETEPRIVFFGLNYSGTSSILHHLKTGDALSETSVPVGYDVGSSNYKNSSFSFFEIGEQCMYRDAQSLLYMVMDEIQGNAPDNADVLVYNNIHLVPGAAMTVTNLISLLFVKKTGKETGMSKAHVHSAATVYMKDSTGSPKTLQECNKQSPYFSSICTKNSNLLIQVIKLFVLHQQPDPLKSDITRSMSLVNHLNQTSLSFVNSSQITKQIQKHVRDQTIPVEL
ncbi:hypothetical protein Bca101_055794 [Brassica carinata]